MVKMNGGDVGVGAANGSRSRAECANTLTLAHLGGWWQSAIHAHLWGGLVLGNRFTPYQMHIAQNEPDLIDSKLNA